MKVMSNFGSQTHISKYLAHKTFRLQPRFTIVHHPVREKFALSLTTYAVIDSVHQLSHRPDHCESRKFESLVYVEEFRLQSQAVAL